MGGGFIRADEHMKIVMMHASWISVRSIVLLDPCNNSATSKRSIRANITPSMRAITIAFTWCEDGSIEKIDEQLPPFSRSNAHGPFLLQIVVLTCGDQISNP